jgi:hypothetical protein
MLKRKGYVCSDTLALYYIQEQEEFGVIWSIEPFRVIRKNPCCINKTYGTYYRIVAYKGKLGLAIAGSQHRTLW